MRVSETLVDLSLFNCAENLGNLILFFFLYRYPEPVSQPIMNRPSNSHIDKVIPNRRPPAPPVRIDTCIVGDDRLVGIIKDFLGFQRTIL